MHQKGLSLLVHFYLTLFFVFWMIFTRKKKWVGKIIWIGQTEPKGNPKAYVIRRAVKFVQNKKAQNKKKFIKNELLQPNKNIINGLRN